MHDEVKLRRALVDEMSDGIMKKDQEHKLMKQEIY